MYKIISLSGNIGSGKDTICQDLIDFFEAKGYKPKRYFFADKLKQFCVDILGLDYNLVHGTQQDKDSYTFLKWENMPGVIITNKVNNIPNFTEIEIGFGEHKNKFIAHSPGNMTIREILQFFGTEICRKMYDSIWVEALIREIQSEEKYNIAIISDTRFHNEMNKLKDNNAILIRLLRNTSQNGLEHISEKQILTYNNYDYILDNRNLSLLEQKEEIVKFIENINV